MLLLLPASSLVGQSGQASLSNRLGTAPGLSFRFTIAPGFNNDFAKDLFVLAEDTLSRPGAQFASRCSRPRLTDTFSINGTPSVYYREQGYTDDAELVERENRMHLLLEVSYRNGGHVEAGVGLHYVNLDSDQRVKPTASLPGDFFYFAEDIQGFSAGLVAHGSYVFFPTARFQPYVGAEISMNINYRKARTTGTFPPFTIR